MDRKFKYGMIRSNKAVILGDLEEAEKMIQKRSGGIHMDINEKEIYAIYEALYFARTHVRTRGNLFTVKLEEDIKKSIGTERIRHLYKIYQPELSK